MVCMNDSGSNFADETVEMVSENANNASAELRKRRSTRIGVGIPVGADLEYADEVTMLKAMEGRRDL